MLTVLLAAGPALAAPQVGVVLRTESEVDVAADRKGVGGVAPGEDALSQHTWLRAFVKDENARGDRWFLEARVQHHLLVGDDVEAWYELGLGETGWDGRLGGPDSKWGLRAGILRERWGKTDLLPVLDVLNPSDARVGPLTALDHRRIPVPMAVLSVGSSTLRSETTVIPFAGADRLWLRETDWSLLRQDMVDDFVNNDVIGSWLAARKDQYSEETSRGLRALAGAIVENAQTYDPSLRRAQDAATNVDGLPQALVGNGEIAQRFELVGPGFDLAVMGGYLRSKFPQAILDPELGTILENEELPPDTQGLQDAQVAFIKGTGLDMSWPRTWLAGIEASGLVGELQVRGEAGYLSNRVVRMHYGNATTVPQLAAAVGVDFVRGTSFQATLEARWQHLFDPPDNLVLARPDQIQIAGGVRAGLASERLQLQIGGVYDASFHEIMVRPTASWRFSDTLQLELGGLFIEGFETDAPAGLLEALTYEGGPASYWSQNDSVTLAISVFL